MRKYIELQKPRGFDTFSSDAPRKLKAKSQRINLNDEIKWKISRKRTFQSQKLQSTAEQSIKSQMNVKKLPRGN